MSLKFSLAELVNPLAIHEPKRVYACSQIREMITLYKLAEKIAYATSLTVGDVYNVLYTLIYMIPEILEAGDSVSLGDFGSFRYVISSEGADSKEDFQTTNIRKVKIRFRPGKLLSPSLDKLQFERVLPVKEKKEALKKNLNS